MNDFGRFDNQMNQELNEEIEALRLLAVTRGIPLAPVDAHMATAALLASWLFAAGLGCPTLEDSAKLGTALDACAHNILSLAAGVDLPVHDTPTAADPTRFSSRTIESSESVLTHATTWLHLADFVPVLGYCQRAFYIAAADARVAAILDVLDSHLAP